MVNIYLYDGIGSDAATLSHKSTILTFESSKKQFCWYCWGSGDRKTNLDIPDGVHL